tara:strand:- start:46 stop:411 length:366 start_codon:yes stop_codon:yes gene_type:complete
MKTQEQFIIDTLLPYKENPKTRAVSEHEYCMYLTDDNRKCAVGQHLIEGEWQYFIGAVSMVDTEYNISDILTDEAKEQNLSVEDWGNIQIYHDDFDTRVSANKSLKLLEQKLNINLGVLYL